MRVFLQEDWSTEAKMQVLKYCVAIFADNMREEDNGSEIEELELEPRISRTTESLTREYFRGQRIKDWKIWQCTETNLIGLG